MNLISRPFRRSAQRRTLAMLTPWLAAAMLLAAQAQAAAETPAVASTATRQSTPTPSLAKRVVEALRNAGTAVSRGLIAVQKARTAGDMVALNAAAARLQAVVDAATRLRESAQKLLAGGDAQLSEADRASLQKQLAELEETTEALEKTSRRIDAETGGTNAGSAMGANGTAANSTDDSGPEGESSYTATGTTTLPPALDPAASPFRL